MDKLKLCPFCGGKAVLVPLSICSGMIACVGSCRFESAKFWDNLLDHEVKKNWTEKAAEAWNRRVGDENAPDVR
jgi:hypothetical protein